MPRKFWDTFVEAQNLLLRNSSTKQQRQDYQNSAKRYEHFLLATDSLAASQNLSNTKILTWVKCVKEQINVTQFL